ncbi:hypothetical protein CQJ38_05960 [Bacillus velezensis]|nr:hypothetical protein CQJ38_05960 [Bacillus velezensis]
MYKVGETVRYWGTRSEGLTWFSSEIMTGRVTGYNEKEKAFEVVAESGATHIVPEGLLEYMTLSSKT